jgi:diadenosine tetraphosphate (Ap4A) HIT family hydrolase
MGECPFCTIDRELLVDEPLALAFADIFPVSPGHTLVIPRRHAATYLDCTADEKLALWRAVDIVTGRLREERRPDGFNLGVNVGATAGQTVFHCHIHVIPRYAGDDPDPRGGVRRVLPAKAAYWKP